MWFDLNRSKLMKHLNCLAKVFKKKYVPQAAVSYDLQNMEIDLSDFRLEWLKTWGWWFGLLVTSSRQIAVICGFLYTNGKEPNLFAYLGISETTATILYSRCYILNYPISDSCQNCWTHQTISGNCTTLCKHVLKNGKNRCTIIRQ